MPDYRKLPAAFERIAQDLTTVFRMDEATAGQGKAMGTTWANQTIMKTRWAWLILPGTLLIASLVLFGYTVLINHRKGLMIWKIKLTCPSLRRTPRVACTS